MPIADVTDASENRKQKPPKCNKLKAATAKDDNNSANGLFLCHFNVQLKQTFQAFFVRSERL